MSDSKERIVLDSENDPWSTTETPTAPAGGDPWASSFEEVDVMVEGDPRIAAAPAEDDPYAGVSRADLIAKMESEAVEKANLQTQADSVNAMKQSLDKLGEAPSIPPAPLVQGPKESDVAFDARMKETFFENPVSNLDEYAMRKIGPILQQQSSMIQSINRTNTLNDPTYGETYRKHSAEIDQLVASRPDQYTNPNVYKEVGDQILVKNLDEIVGEKVKAAMEKQASSAPTTPSRPPAFTETTGRMRSAPSAKPAVLTKAQAEEAKMLGITKEDAYRMANDTYDRSRT